MILLNLFLFLILKGTLANELETNKTKSNETERSGVQMWRAQGDFDKDVLEEFEERGILATDTVIKGLQLWRVQGAYDDDVLMMVHYRVITGGQVFIRNSRTADFLVSDEEQEKLISYLEEHGLNCSLLTRDVREKVDAAFLGKFPVRRSAVSGDSFTWKSYPSLHEINDYLKKMAATYPTHCKIITLGKTLHLKPIYMLKISNGDRNNKAVLVDSGTHGREWTSVISTLYFIDSIVRKFYQQPEYIAKIDWHIIPVLNPDGYDYSLTTDRLWRKNRRKMSGMCYGVDLNRNFDYNWGKQSSTQDSCCESYCGPVPFSEEETKAFKRLTDGTHFNGYLSVHSAGTKVLYPLGADRDDHHQHLLMTKEIALAMRKVDNQPFLNRDIMQMGTNSFGMAMDWMHFVKQIKHSYIIATRGQNGLDIIPSQQIMLAAKEVSAGLMKFAEALK